MKVFVAHCGPNKSEYKFHSPPIGLMYLAAYLEREFPGITIELMDMKVSSGGPEEVADRASEFDPDIIGLGAMTVHAPQLNKTAECVRKRLPDPLIVAGGPHATCFAGKVLDHTNAFDAAVLGEGEKALANIVRAYSNGGSIDDINAVATRKHLDFSERDIIDNLDDLPFPAWDKIDITEYFKYPSFTILGKRKYMALFTSRACPYHCIYCHNIFGNKFRPRSPDSVIEEITILVERYGIRDFDILDDVFNLNKARAAQICNRIIEAGLDIQLAFPNGLRSDLLDEEMITLLRRAGTTYISFAIETASPRLQKLIRKNLKLERAANSIRIANKLGILCNGFFMLGFPTETEDELKMTIDFATTSKLDVAHFLKVTPFEGTQLYDLVDDETRKVFEDHPEYLNYEDRTFNLSEVPGPRFRRIFRSALMKFYLNPIRILRIFAHHPHWTNLIQFIPTALKRVFIKG